MTKYEHLENLIRHCKNVAASTDDERIREVHEDNARILRRRAMSMTVAQAEAEWEAKHEHL